jgi:hypothetical protein
MNVILNARSSQARPSRSARSAPAGGPAGCGALRLPVLLLAAAAVARAGTFTHLEAVDADGVSSWSGSFPIVLTGVLLHRPNPEFVERIRVASDEQLEQLAHECATIPEPDLFLIEKTAPLEKGPK